MAGSCWRLLAARSLIFTAPIFIPISLIFTAPILLLGQDAGPIAPVWIARPPGAPLRYPRVRNDSDFQRQVFGQLVRSAGIIFSGSVTFIGHAASPSRPDPASTTVTFRVENAMRGTSPGQSLTIHEWAGLWTSGERYHVGERVLLFLYSPSKLGLTSPVAGPMGKFAMNSQGQILMSAQQVAILAWDQILSGKTVVSYADFAPAVRRSMREE